MIFRPQLLKKILAGETEAARILEPGYAGSVRRYHSRWQEENRGCWLSWYRRLECGCLERVAECGRRAEALETDTTTEPKGDVA